MDGLNETVSTDKPVNVKTLKKFADVFNGMKLSPGAAAALGGADVEFVRVEKKQKKMDVGLRFTEIVDENCFAELEAKITDAYPFVENVGIDVSYEFGENDETKLAQYWPNVIENVGLISPICRQILRASDRKFDGGLLTVSVPDGVFILTSKKIGAHMESLIKDRLGLGVRVVFEEKKAPSGDSFYGGVSSLLKKEGIVRIPAADGAGVKMNKTDGTALNATADGANQPDADPADETPIFIEPSEEPDDVNGTPNGAGQPGFDHAFADVKARTESAVRAAVEDGARTAAASKNDAPARKKFKNDNKRSRGIKINDDIAGPFWKLSEFVEPPRAVAVKGTVFFVETRELQSKQLLVTFDIYDGSDSVTVKFFLNPAKSEALLGIVGVGKNVKVKGRLQFDEYSKEVNIMADEVGRGEDGVNGSARKPDGAALKRVELHLHTHMSAMDGLASAESYIRQAAAMGHTALAVTDHGVVQAFPEAMEAAKKYGVKIIYGLEAYIVDDLALVKLAETARNRVDGDYVAFDIETTGLDFNKHKITEIGAVRIKDGQLADTFDMLVDPQTPIPKEITDLTGITDEMVRGKPAIDTVLPLFLAFADGAELIAHNARFDMGFIRHFAAGLDMAVENECHDTLALSQSMSPGLKRHKLDTVAEHLNIKIEKRHRACDDALATADIFIKCLEMLADGVKPDCRHLRNAHAVVLVKNQTGLRNLYELVSISHLHHFSRQPRIPKSELLRLRDGLIIGSACESGEFYRAVLTGETEDFLIQTAAFYDYLEIHPTGNNMHLVRRGTVNAAADLMKLNKFIFDFGKRINKPVAAVSDAHFLNPGDSVFRRIIMHVEGYQDAADQIPAFYRTTEEMLEEFKYLGESAAYEAVVTNTNLLADMVDFVKPVPDGTYPPAIEGAEEQLSAVARARAVKLYGDPLPAPVELRLTRELDAIINNGFAVLFPAARALIFRSLECGYCVGSRGSIGSSLAAMMAEITEVNPLPPHYLCPSCKYSDFDSETVKRFAGGSGFDMPDKNCPACGAKLKKDGHDIAFETFMGFGDKEPDIDLNFAGVYQARSHAHTEEIFGAGNVFRVGTIGTMAEKTAYGYVKKYLEDFKITARGAEINRLKTGLIGVKRSSGQHPGGMLIIPADKSVYDFTPVQRPANDMNTDVVTTHFDYGCLEGKLFKLDNLGHDAPTIIHMLHEMTGQDPLNADPGDREVLSLFTSPAALGLTPEDIGCATGTLGLPEFGTPFVRQMLAETSPTTFDGLVRISGLSHGTDVWRNNAQDLINEKTATLAEIIASRDDITLYLIREGIESKTAYGISENVRKTGRQITKDEEDLMFDAGIPEWYIESCRRITYLFPKSHAVAYVMMTVRIGYFKIHYPYEFYAASFTVRAEDFDYEMMCFGRERVYKAIARINAEGRNASAKDKNILNNLELVLEMYARGLNFVPMDLYTADTKKFIVTEDGLMAPLCSVQGLGLNAAESVAEARKDGEFMTVNDFRERTKVNKTVAELLKKVGILDTLQESNQMSLF